MKIAVATAATIGTAMQTIPPRIASMPAILNPFQRSRISA